MSLIDEAKADTTRSGNVSNIDALVAKLVADDRAEDADEVTELLKAPVVGHAAAARVLNRHFAADAGKPITQQQVGNWRAANL